MVPGRGALALALLVGACGDGRPPMAPGRDGGAGHDAGPTIDGGTIDAGGRRDGGARLPPADVDVLLPYLGEIHVETFVVEAEAELLDVHFSIDTTGSFGEEIDAIQNGLDGFIVPMVQAQVEDVAFGVSRFEDFPSAPFGADTDRPFRLLTGVTTDRRRFGSAVAALDSPLGNGGDAPESGGEALYQIATGDGYESGGTTWVPPFEGPAPGGGTIGGVGFRPGALKIVVHVTDAPSHAPTDYGRAWPGTHSVAAAVEALDEAGVRVIGIASASAPRSELEAVALDTGAYIAPRGGTCPTGIRGTARSPVRSRCPLVFDVNPDGTGLASTIVDAIVELLGAVRWSEVFGEAPDDRLGFVEAIEAISAEPPPGREAPERADRHPRGDGVLDTFVDVPSATGLTFEARLRNTTLPPADYDQHFRITLRILGDGLTLEERVVRVTVPAGRLDAGPEATDAGGTDAGGPDAGGTDAGGPDAGGPDAGGTDAGGTDAGGTDAGGTDAGGPDAGEPDAGGPDAGGDAGS